MRPRHDRRQNLIWQTAFGSGVFTQHYNTRALEITKWLERLSKATRNQVSETLVNRPTDITVRSRNWFPKRPWCLYRLVDTWRTFWVYHQEINFFPIDAIQNSAKVCVKKRLLMVTIDQVSNRSNLCCLPWQWFVLWYLKEMCQWRNNNGNYGRQ